MTVTPGLCQSATNTYVLSGSITATNVPTSGTLTISAGSFSPRSLTLPAGNASGTFSYSGLVSDGQIYTVTASYSNSACAPVSATYTAPASCSVAPPCTLSVTASAGVCASATNTYSATVTVALTNATAGTLTISMPGTTPISHSIAAGTPGFTAILDGLPSDGALHTATISLSGCGTTTANFTAPASCSLAPVCSISAVATAGLCQTATNTYSSTVVVTVKNPSSGTLSVTDGVQTLTFATTANTQNTFTAQFEGLLSNATSHTVVATLPGCSTASTTYTAPASCSVAPACSVSAVATAGLCQTATNTYSSTVVVTVKNPSSGTLTITEGAQTQTFSTTAGTQNTFTLVFPGLLSNGASHTVTASLSGCSTATTTYTAPASCSVTPACNLSLTASGSNCNPATNQYVLAGSLTVTNSPTSQSLTLTDGSYVRSLTVNAGTTTINFSYTTLQSDGAVHTVTVVGSGSSCGVASTTYTAPASCSVAPVCSLSAVATPGLCASATNTFSSTVTVTMSNPPAGVLTVTDGVSSLTLAVPATTGTVTAPVIFNGLPSNGANRTVSISLPGCSTASTTYQAPASCPVVAPSMRVSVTPGSCNTATNQYSVSGSLSLSNATASTLTITDGTSTTTVSVTAGQPSASFSLGGLSSGSGSHTVTVSGSGYMPVSASYSAPASCTVAPPCGLSVVITAGVCNSATNQYVVSGSVSAVNSSGLQVVTITDGAMSTTLSVSGGGPSGFSLVGLSSGSGVHTVVASATACGQSSTTYTAPASCSVAPVCSLSAVATPGLCASATNTYSVTAQVTVLNPSAGVITVSNGTSSLTTTVASGLPSIVYPAVFNGLTADGASHTITVTLPGCGSTTASYTAPIACTPSVQPRLELEKFVDKSKAKIGDVLTYTLTLANSSTTTATNVAVRDSSTKGLTFIAGSLTVPTGTTFTSGSPWSTWTVTTLSPGQSLSMTFQVRVDSSGILYNKATIPGDTAIVCTTVPVTMCAGDEYSLTVPAGRANYRWYKNGVLIANQTSNVLIINSPGSYSLGVDNANGLCPTFSCCPFIVEEDSLPTYGAVAISATCQGNVPQNNAQLVLSKFKAGLRYQYSLGATFDPAASLPATPQVIPANGVIATTLTNPTTAQMYTVRVYNSSGCYTDTTVLLMPTVCGCPEDICVPFVLKQTKRPRRIGDPIR